MPKVVTLMNQLEKIKDGFREEILKAESELLDVLSKYSNIAELTEDENELLAILERQELGWEKETD